MPTRRAFTAAEIWTILTAPDAMSGVELGRFLGCNEQSVRVARARLRREGWTCKVAYRTCSYCGRIFTVPAAKTGRAIYHPQCHRLALLEIRRRNAHDRWERTPSDVQQMGLERAHQHVVEHQAQSLTTATAHQRKWEAWEDALILADDAPPDHELAALLGRTLYAIRARRRRLARR